MKECLIIIPCYNEANRLIAAEFIEFAISHQHFSFLFINDGSTDQTLKVLEKIAIAPQINFLSFEKNVGKAEVVRKGILEGLKNNTYSYFAYLDADLAIPLEEFERLYKITTDDSQYGFTFLSKIPRKDAEVNQPFKRYFIGRVLAFFNKVSLKLPIYDTQCGCKIMTREVATLISATPFISAWLFDVEIFWRIINTYGRVYFSKHILEVPLNKLIERGPSSISGKSLLKLPFEYLKIHFAYKK